MKKIFISIIVLFVSLNAFTQISQIAQPDIVYAKFGEIVTFNPLLNDFDPLGNPIIIDTVFSNDVKVLFYNDSLVTFKMIDYSLEQLRIRYKVFDTISIINWGSQISIFPNVKFDTLNRNNIKAVIYPGNMQFWDLFYSRNFTGGNESAPQYFYPADQTSSTFFTYGLWMGGVHQNSGNLHLAAERYRQVGTDFWPGPLTNNGLALADSINAGKWCRTWKVGKEEIQYHLRNYNNQNYIIPEAIQNWPAHGDQSIGQAEFLAPFVDVDLDREYQPENGDYPLIKGDESVFFIYNDRLEHSETGGRQIGLEIHCMAWAFKDQEEKEDLNSTVFYSYKFFNRSMITYDDFYIGAWSDFDLGYLWDDYIGCHVEQGYYYVYNGRDIDGGGEPESYGENPPTQGTCFLGGPYQNSDAMDNPDGGCDESINGIGFGDGIIDNERLGMSYFLFHCNTGPAYYTDPGYAEEYYQLLRGKWKDDSPLVYGGNAHPSMGGDSLYPTRFMWPGNSDSCNWGTNGLEPSWDTIWTEETSGNHYGDRRGMGSVGPFTFEAGSVEYLDIALVTAPGDQGKDSKDLLQDYVAAIRADYIKNPEEFGNQYLGEEDISEISEEGIQIFPNPVNGDQFYIILPVAEKGEYCIYNSAGQSVQEGFLSAQKQQQIDIAQLDHGWYVLEVKMKDKTYRAKLIK